MTQVIELPILEQLNLKDRLKSTIIKERDIANIQDTSSSSSQLSEGNISQDKSEAKEIRKIKDPLNIKELCRKLRNAKAGLTKSMKISLERKPSFLHMNSDRTIEKLISEWRIRKRKNSLFVKALPIFNKDDMGMKEENGKTKLFTRMLTNNNIVGFK